MENSSVGKMQDHGGRLMEFELELLNVNCSFEKYFDHTLITRRGFEIFDDKQHRKKNMQNHIE